MVKQMVTAYRWVCFFQQGNSCPPQEMCCDRSISVILSPYDVRGVTCNGTRARFDLDSAGLPRPHREDCPLTQSNEIILGEAMLKMNHFLAIPWRRGGHISLGPCSLTPSILHHRAGRGFTHHRQSHAPACPLQTKAHDRKPPSNPIMTRLTPAAAFSQEILGYCDFFFLLDF